METYHFAVPYGTTTKSTKYRIDNFNGGIDVHAPHGTTYQEVKSYLSEFTCAYNVRYHPDEYVYCPWCNSIHPVNNALACVKVDLALHDRIRVWIGRVATNKYDVFEENGEYYARVPQDFENDEEVKAFLNEFSAYLNGLRRIYLNDKAYYYDKADFVLCQICGQIEPKNKRFECVAMATPLS